MIYLASPYAHPDPAVMEERFHLACLYAAQVMKDGDLIYSPIAHNHPIAVRTQLPRDWNFWRQFDLPMLRMCSELRVLKLDGWWKSRGVKAECEYAEQHGIRVTYVNPILGIPA